MANDSAKQSLILDYYLNILSSQYQFEGVNSKAVVDQKLHDRTFIEEDNSKLQSLESMGMNVTSLNGKDAPGCVEAQTNLSVLLVKRKNELGNIMEIGGFWREYANQLVVFTGHGFIKNGRFALYLEYYSHGTLSVGHFCIQEYWLQWWSFICDQEMTYRNTILVFDMCHSGAVIAEFQEWLGSDSIRAKLLKRNCSITVQASCGRDEFSKGGYFLSAWLLSLRNPSDSVQLSEDADVPHEAFDQHPVYATSDATVNRNKLTLGDLTVTLFDDARTLHSVWLLLKQGMLTFVRAPPTINEQVRACLTNNEYRVLDVKPFKSQVVGFEYQLVVVLESNRRCQCEQLTWNQHLHLDSTSLARGIWKVSPKISARIVEVVVVRPEADGEFHTYRLHSNILSEPVVEEGACKIGFTHNAEGQVLVSKSSSRVEEQKRGKVKTEITFTGTSLSTTAEKLVGNIKTFISDRPKKIIYVPSAGGFWELGDWFAEATRNDGQLPPHWNLAISICGMTRTRGVGAIFGEKREETADNI
ncbi:hypothetical protein EON65_46105 [archaeon]|nr:MAG: hypothetical protein EON65_46105 [archaeon]